MERAAVACMGGARAGHINSLVSTEMDTVLPVEVCLTKSTTNRACKDIAADVISLCKRTASKCTQNRDSCQTL